MLILSLQETTYLKILTFLTSMTNDTIQCVLLIAQSKNLQINDIDISI